MPETGPRPEALGPGWTDAPKVVLVHDWLTGMRGGEKVLESLCRLFPSAPILTLVHVPGSVSELIERHPIRTSIVQKFPRSAELYRQYLPLFPAAIELFDLDDADVVISTSHCAAKSIVPTGRAIHICYCHSPMRYAWDQFDMYFGRDRVGAARHELFREVMAWLARWDRATAHRVHRFVANSHFVAGRIARYYNRRASVLYPPVDTQFFTPGGDAPERYFLVVSALVPYKRIDVAILAAARLRVPLKIVGTGPELDRLRALAGPTVEFLGRLNDDDLRQAYRRAQAVLLPAEEDFGIVPVESLACGRPVIALGRGGASETMVPDETGLLVDQATPDAFADAMSAIGRRSFDLSAMRARAEMFGRDRFESQFASVVAELSATPHAAC
jgi:glycosyltransferase involved in cell wall biosynthesis